MAMFSTKAQEKEFGKVGKLLNKAFPDRFKPRPDAPSYVGVEGSALVEVWVYPWRESQAAVNVRSCCVMDMGDIPADCLRFLLDENFTFALGAFSLDKDGDINFEHTMPATNLDKEELEASVRAVAGTADRYDDQITSRWGGVTGKEKFLQIAKQLGLTP